MPHREGVTGGLTFERARHAAYTAGRAALLAPAARPLRCCDGTTLAADVRAGADLPAFPTASVDGYAVRGPGPWRLAGRVLAGEVPGPLERDGGCVSIATGAMVPEGTEAILRTEDARVGDAVVSGTPRPKREWRLPGEEAARGERLVAAGTPVTPALLGLAAAAGHDTLVVRDRPRAAVIAPGPQLPAWLRRLGAACLRPVAGPGALAAVREAVDGGADLIVCAGGTTHEHLRALGATAVVDTVRVRPGPMLLAAVPGPGGRTVPLAVLPADARAAVPALLTLVAPVVAGLTGRPLPALPSVELATPVPGRAGLAHLVPVGLDEHGRAHPVPPAGPAMLRGLATAAGFAVIPARHDGRPGAVVPLLPLPLGQGVPG
ncbi:molybdopterin molybdenumtransferase MoeA [Dactylosporangium sp. CA-092794]|uniref:molybdopterin molybdenumtransferase MoeA n=1 Tax=Dactylosporangium sp. CA-092794 TaxID=3239929 RepID=UPI003D8DF400